ncbi:MAG: Txe/YoeB family addiction module toxin [Defluviitaleaceae bacterium]|nr:Txe/YoeB family addiction module toxin [Defluviitaleaceae bacterium]
MINAFHGKAWKEYLNWQKEDKKTIIKIHSLIKGVSRNDFETIGKPEKLKHDLAGWLSLHIDKKNRLVYKITRHDDKIFMEILSCKNHYSDT